MQDVCDRCAAQVTEGVNLLFAYTAAKLDSAAAVHECCAECCDEGDREGEEVMPKARSATELLDGYGDVIEACRSRAQIGDQYWNSIYLPLISSIADYFQLLTDRSGECKLFATALNVAHNSPRIVCCR